MGANRHVWVLDVPQEPYADAAAELLRLDVLVTVFGSLDAILTTARSPHAKLPQLIVVGQAQLPALLAARSTAPRVALLLDAPLLVLTEPDSATLAQDLRVARILARPLPTHNLVAAITGQLQHGLDAPDVARLRLDVTLLSVRHGDTPSVSLTPREFQILALLSKAEGRCATRAELFAQVWAEVKVCNKVLDVHVSKLRRKLAPLGATITFFRPASYQLDLNGSLAALPPYRGPTGGTSA